MLCSTFDRFTAAVFFLLMLCVFSEGAVATDYYVSASGNDGDTGTSPGTAWQTIAPVNTLDIEPGDRILLAGGESFAGTLTLDETDTGTPLAPVVISSFGVGRATIDANMGSGIVVTDCAGISIENINVIGSGTASNTGRGIGFFTAKTDGSKFERLRIDRVDVSGFREGGISIASDHSSLPGFRDVRITNVRAFANGETGISVSGIFKLFTPALSHEDVYIGYSEVFDNFGDPTNLNSHTGNGIIISATDGAVIEYCHAHHNGGVNSQNSGGPVGIWTWQSNDVTIQHNISHHNRTGGGADGGGFDFDGGVSNSVMQYNYSYENDGAGYLLAQFFTSPAFENNVVRYNVSYNDGRRNGYGGVLMFADVLHRMDNIEIYGNTFYVSSAASGSPAAIRVFRGAYGNVNFRNNIFMTAPGVELIRSSPALVPGQVNFQGNAYWTSDTSFVVEAGGATYTSLAGWRATGQEMVGIEAVGLHADPLLVSPTNPQLLTDPARLTDLIAYQARAGSPIIGAGLDLLTLFGLDPGPRDFFGTLIPAGVALNMGAAQSAGASCTDLGGCEVPIPALPGYSIVLLVLGLILCALRVARRKLTGTL